MAGQTGGEEARCQRIAGAGNIGERIGRAGGVATQTVSPMPKCDRTALPPRVMTPPVRPAARNSGGPTLLPPSLHPSGR